MDKCSTKKKKRNFKFFKLILKDRWENENLSNVEYRSFAERIKYFIYTV